MKQMSEVFELPVVGYQLECIIADDVSGLTEDYAAHAINHVDALAENLEEALIQIKYLHQKFGETGSGNAVLSHGYAALNAYGGIK